MKQTLASNQQLIKQTAEHNKQELRKGEMARKDLIDQNAILHGQVEKVLVPFQFVNWSSRLHSIWSKHERHQDNVIDDIIMSLWWTLNIF